MTTASFVDRDMWERFTRRGYDVTPLLSPEQVMALESSYAHLPSPRAEGFHATMSTMDRDYRRAVYERLRPIVVDLTRGVLDGYRVCVANYLVKEAGDTDSRVDFHCDWSFIDERLGRSVNLWIPLIDVDERNGCLEVVEGSHMASTEPRAHADFRFHALASRLRARYARPVPMTCGQALLYDGALLHSSPPNRSSQRRIAVGAVLVPEGAQIIHCFRVSPTAVEVFAVDEPFFWSHVPGERPLGVPLLGVVASSTVEHADDLLARFVARV